jgi:serine/threonine-protein kinase
MDDGAVRLLYTGWTRLRQQAAAHLGSSSIPGLSGYLSPQQARGEVPTPKDDLWSLAAIVFELLTGAPLRSGDTDEEKLAQARHPDVGSIEAMFRDAPRGIAELMERALSQNEARRINSAAEFAAKCRSLALFPEILGLRRLNGPNATAERLNGTRPSDRQTQPARASANAPGNSGVSALNLPLTSATGTTEYRPSHAPGMLHGNAGTYSSHGSERVETLFPKKR